MVTNLITGMQSFLKTKAYELFPCCHAILLIRTQLKPENSHTMYPDVIIRISPSWRLEGSAIRNMHDWLHKAPFTEKQSEAKDNFPLSRKVTVHVTEPALKLFVQQERPGEDLGMISTPTSLLSSCKTRLTFSFQFLVM